MLPPALLYQGHLRADGGVSGVGALLQAGMRFFAVLAGNDLVAIGAMESLLELIHGVDRRPRRLILVARLVVLRSCGADIISRRVVT